MLLKSILFPFTLLALAWKMKEQWEDLYFTMKYLTLKSIFPHSLLLETFHSRSILSTSSPSPSLTWADHRGRVAIRTVKTTQGSHRATPQEGLSPWAVKSGCWDLITSFHQVWSSRGGDGNSTAELTTDNIGIGQTPVGGTECSPSPRNIHLHLPLTLRGAIFHESDFCVHW